MPLLRRGHTPLELLYDLESQADEIIGERIWQTTADALSQYKPMREECDVAMARHHSYERTLITNHQVRGEMRLDAPVFRCGDCGAMRGGMEVIGKGQMRKLYSKKYAMRLAALGVSYERVGSMLGFAKSTLRKWLKQEKYTRPKLSGDVLELDGVWTRVAGGNVELKLARDERGVAPAAAGSGKTIFLRRAI